MPYAPIHDRQPTILEPRDYAEYLCEDERPPFILLAYFRKNQMKSRFVDRDSISNQQAKLFDSR